MKKITLLLAMIVLSAMGGKSQTLLYNENFESYTVGGFLAAQNPTWWTTWANAPGTGEDAYVKNDQAHSPAKSVLIEKTTVSPDILLKLGDKTTGKYELSWWMYVGIGNCGYYSLLHSKSTEGEYALSVYFRQNGDGELFAGSTTPVLFAYPKATWFKVKHLIDLDADKIKLYINGTLLKEWPFSYQPTTTTGTKQLNSADFFPALRSGSAEIPKFYFDDVYFAQLSALGDPIIGVAPSGLSSYLNPGTSNVRQFSISNTGTSNLDYNLNVIYKKGSPVKQGSSMNTASSEHAVLSLSESPAIHTNGSLRSGAANATLRYDGDYSTAIGWTTLPATVTVAARFPNAMTLPYAGMSLESVDVYINQLNATGNEMALKVFGMGTASGPGASLVSQTFTPVAASWNHIVLTTPLRVSGEDLWVGYQFTQKDASIYIPGTDAGPNVPNGDFFTIGAGWVHLSNNAALPYNWNIRANLTGDAMAHWLTVDPMSGTIAPADQGDVNASFNTTGLNLGQYDGIIRILNDDPTKTQLDVPCTLSISVGIDELDKVAVMVYPNPAGDRLNILSNDKLLKVSIIGSDGQIIVTGNENALDISSLPAGAYFVQTLTAKGTTTIKFTKK